MAESVGSVRVLLLDAQEMAGLGAVRSLGRAGHRVTVAHTESAHLPPARLSRYTSPVRALRHPDPWTRQFAFRDWLLAQVQHGSYDAILPISEASIVAVAALRTELLRAARRLLLPSDHALRYTLSKYHATILAQRLGLLVPRTVLVSDGTPGGAWNDDLSALPGPLVIKIDNELTADGVYHKGQVVRADSAEEAAVVLSGLRGRRASILAQERFDGHGVGVFLLRHGGEVRLRFGHQRLHEVPYTGGFSSLRVSAEDPALLAEAERLLAAIDYDGVAMVEFRREPDGAARFLEINGRLWGSLALALHAGVDFPAAWLAAELGQASPRPQPPYPRGLRCRNVFPGELLHLESVVRADALTGADKLRAVGEFAGLSLRPGIRHDFLWRDDPVPGLWQAARESAELGLRLAHHGQRTLQAALDRRRLMRLSQPERLVRVVERVRRGGPVLFVCHGNICRSPFAAVYWNQLVRKGGGRTPPGVSAGLDGLTGRPTPPLIGAVVRGFGVDLSAHRSQALTAQMIDQAGAVLIMDGINARALFRAFPGALDRTAPLGAFAPTGPVEIADPFLLDAAAARKVYQHLSQSLDGLFSYLAG